MELRHDVQQLHHVEDVGRILLQTQEQLRQLREQLAAQQVASGLTAIPPGGNTTVANSLALAAGAELDEILQRAEGELRVKAELVLNNLVTHPTPTPTSPTAHGGVTLPAVTRARDSSVSPHRRLRLPRRLSLESAPDDGLDVHYFRQRFTNDAVEIVSPALSPAALARRVGATRGRIVKSKVTPHARLLPSVNKLDPTAPRPELSPMDAKQGILSLVNRGFVPPYADLTPAFQGGPASRPGAQHGSVLKNGPLRLHARHEQPIRALPYSNPGGFNLSTLKFDMTSEKAASPASRVEDERVSQPPSVKTVTISFPGVAQRRDGLGSTNQDSVPHDELDLDDDLEDTGTTAAGEQGEPKPGGAKGDKEEQNSMEDLRKNVDKIRGYNELLDAYSLHQFLIHKGRAMRDTPEFQSFRRVSQEIWGSVEEVLRALEQLLTRYFVPLAYIDGQRLMTVASMELTSFSKAQLLSCIVNEDQVASLIRRPGQRYKGKDRKRRAATTLQSFVRMLVHRRWFLRTRRNGTSAMIIQKHWRAFAAQRAFRRRLDAHRTAQLQQWRGRMTRLREHWREIRQSRRVVVHVPSISVDERARLSVENFTVKQNLQLARLCGVMDPNVEIVYVVPFELTAEVSQYFLKLLSLGGIANASSRVKLVSPEHATTLFPAHTSLTSLVLYSPHCLRRLRRLVHGKEAYLVMGMPGPEDQRLALTLQVPILGFEDPRAGLSLLARSEAKRCLIKADVNVPIGTYDLYDVDEMLFALAKLVLSHLEQDTWLLRLDTDPWGTATVVVPVSTLSTLRSMRRERRAPEYWKQPGVRDTIARTLLTELERDLPAIAKICHTERFATWSEFAALIPEYGVVLEALPSHVLGVVRANLFVEPDGDVHVMSTHDVLGPTGATVPMQSQRRCPLAFAFPQTLVPFEALRGASLAIGKQLYDAHTFMGYASVDFVFFRDEPSSAASVNGKRPVERLWAVSLLPYLTDAAASFAAFHLLHGGEWNGHTGRYHLPARTASASLAAMAPTRPGPTRSYVVADYVFHPNVSTMQYTAFFHTCRLHGVCFDVSRGVGTVFLLADSLTAGVFGVWSSGETVTQALQFLRTAFEVIGREVGTQTLSSGDDGGDGGGVVATGNFAEILRMLRQLLSKDQGKTPKARVAPTPQLGGAGEADAQAESTSSSVASLG
ncbi:hypothetical protein ATCC90586_008493 [Pythium insidiosum]|nr:hypothetical protein ATCC90586_008493 [Pythium insidiosum]